ncbi:MAG: P-II family nitrogen regulator [Nitrosopumilus sp.]|nr:P-II family nitrogen regulator [Nitrosopumilus sp.]MDH3385912.1 P-II family nitrogen regulator [Nitrosopumilus sp.]
MKRIEIIVQSEISRKVIQAIRNVGVSGVTLIESLGQGGGERPEIGGKQIEFNSTDVIITIVNDSQIDPVISAIMATAHTGNKGDGKIFITNVEQSYDISTKQKSSEII